MKTTTENGKLIFHLTGRIDATNSGEVQTEIMDMIAKHPGDKLILDADGLNYISSSGLRVLLDAQKQFGDQKLTVKNVSNEVYEIFDVTGVNELMNVEKNCAK